MLKTACTLALLMLIGTAQADTYRWVDADGVVNYSERKPRGVDAQLVSKSSRPQQDQAPAATTPTLPTQGNTPGTPATGDLSPEQLEMKAELEAAEKQRQQQIAKIRQDNCERARRVLANLSTEARLRIQDEDGNQRAMPEEERQQRITEAQKGIVANCQS